MLYTIHFHDNANADPDIRPRFMQQHLAFLDKNQAAIRAAGPLKEIDGAVKSGLWLVDVEIKQWAQVFADGQALD